MSDDVSAGEFSPDPHAMLLIIADGLEHGFPIPPAVSDWFLGGINRWMMSTASLDEALSMRPGRGARRGSAIRRMAARDVALRTARDLLGKRGRPTLAAARATFLALEIYRSSQWHKVCAHRACPHPPGTLDAALWTALRHHKGRPLGIARLRQIFANAAR